MRKEVVWAIAAGIILGLVVAFGVWRINSTISTNNDIDLKNKNITNSTPTPLPITPGQLKIVIDKPNQNDVITQNSVTVSGITKPGIWVTLSGEDSDLTVQADTGGGFSQDVDLIPGVNQIKVTAFDSSGVKSESGVLVVFSSSFQLKTASPNVSASDSSATSDIKAKVAQDLANVVSAPKSYIGIVTDITDSTIQIKNMTSQIEQISTNAQTSVINSTGTASKTVKTTDIAIGDFIVAMGYVDGKNVLSAQRILVTDPITEPKITINEAKITSTTKKQFNINILPDNSTDTVQPSSKTDLEIYKNNKFTTGKLTDYGSGDIIIYVEGTDDKGVTVVRSIFQIQKSQS